MMDGDIVSSGLNLGILNSSLDVTANVGKLLLLSKVFKAVRISKTFASFSDLILESRLFGFSPITLTPQLSHRLSLALLMFKFQ